MRQIDDIWDWLPLFVVMPLQGLIWLFLFFLALTVPIALIRRWHWLYRVMWNHDVI